MTDLALFEEKSFFNKHRFATYFDIALMETASFYDGVRHKRYSEQQEMAPDEIKF
ncbi:hypothetical protein [Flavobacterium luteum]|uniref:hypothetical protein n=1 Tax=Flavobacterium luteum TaxID=2026654 RepID=UPI00177C00B3|nr:hypothetical protein [Flavobacterium luteum]